MKNEFSRLETIFGLLAAPRPLISGEDALSLLDFPDIDDNDDGGEMLPTIRIAYYGEYVAPDPLHCLNEELKRALVLAEDPWCPPVVRGHLRRYAREAAELLRSLQGP